MATKKKNTRTKKSTTKKATKSNRVHFAQMVKTTRGTKGLGISKKDAQRVYDLRVASKAAMRAEDEKLEVKLWNQAAAILDRLGCTVKDYQIATAKFGIRTVRA